MVTKYNMNMQAERDGEWVELKDYESLEKDYEQLKQTLDDLCDDIDNLYHQLEEAAAVIRSLQGD